MHGLVVDYQHPRFQPATSDNSNATISDRASIFLKGDETGLFTVSLDITAYPNSHAFYAAGEIAGYIDVSNDEDWDMSHGYYDPYFRNTANNCIYFVSQQFIGSAWGSDRIWLDISVGPSFSGEDSPVGYMYGLMITVTWQPLTLPS